MNKKVFVGIVLIALAATSLSGCINQSQNVNIAEEEKVPTEHNVTGTIYRVTSKPGVEWLQAYARIDIIFLDNKTTIVLTAYRYYDRISVNFDWYGRLTDLIGEKVTVYFTEEKDTDERDITRIECLDRK